MAAGAGGYNGLHPPGSKSVGHLPEQVFKKILPPQVMGGPGAAVEHDACGRHEGLQIFKGRQGDARPRAGKGASREKYGIAAPGQAVKGE